MTREDINNIISTICPNDEDFEKPIISPRYLKQELEQLALEQEPKTNYKTFAEWVAREVIDEENWEWNSGAFPELACRKLNKLGVVDTDGKRWIYENEDMITHIEAVQDNLNRIVDGLDDDTDYYDATYHLEQIKEKVEQEPKTDVLDKIRAIVKEWKDDSWTDGLSYECMIKISELFTESEV